MENNESVDSEISEQLNEKRMPIQTMTDLSGRKLYKMNLILIFKIILGP